MNRRRFLLTTASAALAGPALGQFRPAGDDLPELAEKAARTAFGFLTGKLQTAGRVAVFAPGDKAGKLTLAMHEASRILQGEMIYSLINLARGRFAVLDKAALAQAFAKAEAKPEEIDRANPQKTGTVLTKLGLDAALLGTFEDSGGTEIDAKLQLVFKDGSARPIAGQVSHTEFPRERSSLLPRVRPEIWLTPEGEQPRKLPIVTAKGFDSPYSGILFCALPAGLALGTKAAQYKIRLINTGEGGAGCDMVQPTIEREKQRLFTVALAIDGVNSLYQDRGDGQIGPVMVDPRHARKWVLTGPGLRIVMTGPRPIDYRSDPAPGTGNSVTDVPGFQKDPNTSLTFTLAEGRDSIAGSVGGVDDIGAITAIVYAQKMRGDESPNKGIATGPMPGTKAGGAKRNPTVRIQVDTYPYPVATYRIFYRPEADIPIPAADRREV